MRIVAGKYRHRLIAYPATLNIRPTKDMVREALFNALSLQVVESCVLDLFAGSGAYGIEALSRGARKATFVDDNASAVKCIKDNLSSLEIISAEILHCDYNVALRSLQENNEHFDIVFLDPPYAMNNYQEIINLLNQYCLFEKNAIIVCESDKELEINEELFTKIRKYQYGKTYIQILWR